MSLALGHLWGERRPLEVHGRRHVADFAAEQKDDRGVVGPGEQSDHRANRAIHAIEMSERAQGEREELRANFEQEPARDSSAKRPGPLDLGVGDEAVDQGKEYRRRYER